MLLQHYALPMAIECVRQWEKPIIAGNNFPATQQEFQFTFQRD